MNSNRDTTTNLPQTLESPSREYEAVNLAGDVVFTDRLPRSFYIGGDGDLKVDDCSGNPVTFTGLLAGIVLPVSAKKVYSSSNGTSASNVIALY